MSLVQGRPGSAATLPRTRLIYLNGTVYGEIIAESERSHHSINFYIAESVIGNISGELNYSEIKLFPYFAGISFEKQCL